MVIGYFHLHKSTIRFIGFLSSQVSRQNLLNSNFLEKILVNNMRLKLISYIDCFWNLSLSKLSSNPKSSLANSRSN